MYLAVFIGGATLFAMPGRVAQNGIASLMPIAFVTLFAEN